MQGKQKNFILEINVLAGFVFGWNQGDAAFELNTYVGGKIGDSLEECCCH